MLISILGITLSCYVALMLYFRVGLARSSKSSKTTEFEPSVTVIVAARNEQQFIGSCVGSLLKLDYPPEKLELVIVNDGSSDQTQQIAESFAGPGKCLRIITSGPVTGNLRGKANALASGIAASSGEILMFTDADCIVPPSWVRATVRYFESDTAVVGGFTLLEGNQIFQGIQALDWFYLFGIACAMAGHEKPLTVIGNNLAVRRTAYESVGGYERIPFSVTEDYSLVRTIIDKTHSTVRFPMDPEALVQSHACASWRDLFRQKQRWSVGGLNMVLAGIVVMGIVWITKTSLVITMFSSHLGWLTAGIATACVFDYLFLLRLLRPFRLSSHLRFFLPFEVYLSFYSIVIPLVAALSRKVVWKERSL